MKLMTNLEWYKLCVWVYSKISIPGNGHRHHIKPKCLYPELADDEFNIVEVPAIVHWALHKLLYAHYLEVGNDMAASKLKHVNLQDFINNYLMKAPHSRTRIIYDFEKQNEMLEYIKNVVQNFALVYRDISKNSECLKNFEKSLNKRIKDYTDEEKQKRISLKDNIKSAKARYADCRQELRFIGSTMLKKFGTTITDELDKFSDLDVINLVNS